MPEEPAPETVRHTVVRGRITLLDVPKGDPSAIAKSLSRQLAEENIRVFVSGSARLTALQLVSAEEAQRVRPELERLITDFRRMAHTLTEQYALGALDEEQWCADPHGEHCRFENRETGILVEAHTEDPDKLDPYFLLVYAETTGHYPTVLTACVHGYHDMSHLLETLPPNAQHPA